MSLPAAVLFDMDGTLIDSEGLWLSAEISLMTDLGSTWDEADQAHCLGGPLERVAAYMITRSGTDRSLEDVMTLLLEKMERRLRDSPLAWRPGAREVLLDAREHGIATALVSASWKRLIDAVGAQIADDLGRPAFDVIVAGDDVTNSKPHPEPYETAARLLDAEPSACLALEDSPTGVASATSAGCKVIAIPHIADIDAPGAVVIGGLEGFTIESLWAKFAS